MLIKGARLAVLPLAAMGLAAVTEPVATRLAQVALDSISIPNADDIRGSITLQTSAEALPGIDVQWKSSDPNIITDKPTNSIAAGAVKRPPFDSPAAKVTLTACINTGCSRACREFHLTVQPLVRMAAFTRYGMVNFARSNQQLGQQIYMASSAGNEATNWISVNNGKAYLNSTKGMHAVRDPSIVRSPEGDRFFLVATDLNVDGKEFGWQGWDWAQSNASRYIEVWESRDLRTWSEQRHVLVASAEAGMTYAPEAIWDPEIGAYVVYWTSSMYPAGTYFTTNTSDANRRYPLTPNNALYATTRDFINFTPAKMMSARPNHGTLDAVIIKNDASGYYHRIVCDRTSTGNATKYVKSCNSEDIYQERAMSILAKEDDWELVRGCITHDVMNTTYAEAPLIIKANPGDPRGKGWYMYVDQKWEGSPSGAPLEEQLNPYWSADIESGQWTPLNWTQKPDYEFALGVIRHGTIFALTSAEHAALRGADLVSISITPPKKIVYVIGEELDLSGLVVTAIYNDGTMDDSVSEGYGGYKISGFDSKQVRKQQVIISFSVVKVTKTATFEVEVVRGP